ncbi:MAG: low molecular weight phosphatase family protein [Acidobacteriota bacterium]
MRHYRVLFVCIGNACRSQMAEAFARAYGRDVLIAKSAGLHPTEMVAPATAKLMSEKNISLDDHAPKGLDVTGTQFDVIVNMSGLPLPGVVSAPVRQWKVEDPIWLPEERHRQVRDQIENLVRELIGEFRKRRNSR